MKKLLLIATLSVLLSACTLLPQKEDAASDSQLPSPTVTPSESTLAPADVNEIKVFESSQQTSASDDILSLESDLDATLVPEDDLSDLLE